MIKHSPFWGWRHLLQTNYMSNKNQKSQEKFKVVFEGIMALPWQSGPEGMGFQGKIFFLQGLIKDPGQKDKEAKEIPTNSNS